MKGDKATQQLIKFLTLDGERKFKTYPHQSNYKFTERSWEDSTDVQHTAHPVSPITNTLQWYGTFIILMS